MATSAFSPVSCLARGILEFLFIQLADRLGIASASDLFCSTLHSRSPGPFGDKVRIHTHLTHLSETWPVSTMEKSKW